MLDNSADTELLETDIRTLIDLSLPRLNYLSLCKPVIKIGSVSMKNRGVKILAGSRFTKLTTLNLNRNQITNEGVRWLLRGPFSTL